MLSDELDALILKEVGQWESSIDFQDGRLYFKNGLPIAELRIGSDGFHINVDIFSYKNKLREKND